jgi:hypothetical protein
MNIQAASAHQKQHQADLDEVGRILEINDRPTKWREAVRYYLRKHPQAAYIYRQVAKDCAEKRQEYELSNTGLNRTAKKSEFNQNMHARVDLPSFAHYAICAFDPEFATIMSGAGTNFAQAKWSRMMRKAFPEFVVNE